jgi:hypothetical protein
MNKMKKRIFCSEKKRDFVIPFERRLRLENLNNEVGILGAFWKDLKENEFILFGQEDQVQEMTKGIYL